MLMEQRTIKILFALLRSAISGTELTDGERALYLDEQLHELMLLSRRHDVDHLVAFALRKNSLAEKSDANVEKTILKAVYRYERLNFEYKRLCTALEAAKIPFLPLKGSILRDYYPEPWMRTSGDIDVLVHGENLERTVSYLVESLKYTENGRGTHEVKLVSPLGNHFELHFDLVEEGRANNAISVLASVWENVTLREGSECWYEMNDAFFYFYHVAHMAKHFENGGCGIRPFIDMWILDRLDDAGKAERDELLSQGGLLKFADLSRKLSEVWFDDREPDTMSRQLQNFLLHGGVYGSFDNRVALQQKKKGGRLGYFMSRMFIPYSKLKRYYPVLEKYKWLMPVMQVRRWSMLLRPEIARMAKTEMSANISMEKSKAKEMNDFLFNIGL